MMDNLFCKIECLSESKRYNFNEIREDLFDKRVDGRFLDYHIQRFINFNQRMFDFIGIKAELSGSGRELSLSFSSSDYIGAIPIKMPYDGLVHKDFIVTPKFVSNLNVNSELTQLLSRLDYSIQPEYSRADLLVNLLQSQPPTFYEALKYIELFDKAYKQNWVKFDSKDQIHPYPKASTNWTKHALASFDPKRTLQFPSHDSVLTINHTEWRNLKYVFDLAKEQINAPTTPASIQYTYEEKIRILSSKVSSIKPETVDKVVVRAGDPQCIKELKAQANIILKKYSNSNSAWRMSMSTLFERYIQAVVEMGSRELGGIVSSNEKLTGSGNIPSWGLKYLEPDIMIRFERAVFMADAKYKSHFYNSSAKEGVLKETHREDLHQLLAYCSFEPQEKKVGIIFYPAKETSYKNITYTDRFSGVSNKVILCGVAFGINEMKDTANKIKKLFSDNIFEVSTFGSR